MGVKNLWLILSPICERKSLWELNDKAVAIDLSCWVCDSQNIEHTNQPRMYLRNLFFRTSCLLLLGVKPIFVLEGRAPVLKHDTISQRVQQRCRNKKQSPSEGSACSQQERSNINRSRLNAILKQCQELLTNMGVPCVQSSGEAEALCAQLNESGLVDGCITQDGDCFLYGAQTVYRNFTISQQGSTGFSVEEYKMAVMEEKLALSRQKLIALSLLCGCDYNDKGVLGVGKETALRFLEGLQDDKVLDRLKQWRSDPAYERLEAEYSTLSNTCIKCTHVGKLQKHTKLGCNICGTQIGCVQTSDIDHLSQKDLEERKVIIAELTMRRKALQDDNFPSQVVVEEFMHRQPLPKLDLNWKQPSFSSFINYSTRFLNWTEYYAAEKFVPLITRWQLHHLQNKNGNSDQLALPFMPCEIIKKRILKSVQSFEIRWKDSHGLLQNLEQTEKLLVTVEPQEMFNTAYPNVVEKFMKEKETKSKKGKTKSRKPKTQAASAKICSCQCKENGTQDKKVQQSHLCSYVKTSSKSDVSEIQKQLDNLNISSKVEKENVKKSCNSGTEIAQSSSKITKEHSQLNFNHLFKLASRDASNNMLLMCRNGVVDENIKTENVGEFDERVGGTGQSDDSSHRFLGIEECCTTSKICIHNVYKNGPLNNHGVKSILEEYDCLDTDDEIMDMSSIIASIIGENCDKSVTKH